MWVNNFPLFTFNNILQKYLEHKLDYRPRYLTVNKLKIYLSLPFLGQNSDNLSRELRSLLNHYFPFLDPIFYFRSHNKIGSWFCLKDRPNPAMRSNVIYQYKCDCDQSYIGSTTVQLFIRCAQHRGFSHRTGRPLSRPSNSSIRDHCDESNHRFKTDKFSIIGSTHNSHDLRILESIYIYKK